MNKNIFFIFIAILAAGGVIEYLVLMALSLLIGFSVLALFEYIYRETVWGLRWLRWSERPDESTCERERLRYKRHTEVLVREVIERKKKEKEEKMRKKQAKCNRRNN